MLTWHQLTLHGYASRPSPANCMLSVYQRRASVVPCARVGMGTGVGPGRGREHLGWSQGDHAAVPRRRHLASCDGTSDGL